MADGANPIAALALRQLMERIAGGAAEGPEGVPPDAASIAIARNLGELRRADPSALADAINEAKRLIVSIYPQSAFVLPGVANGLAAAIRGLDNALKVVQQALATQQAAGPPLQAIGLPGAEQGGGALPAMGM